MSRLLTVGCSFTFYKWPSWANYLAGNFSEFLNKGIPGGDNATIARITTSMAEPGDTVIVMWSSYQRHNYKVNFKNTYNYDTEGVHIGGSNIYNKSYFTDVYNQYERFLTTLDYLQWAITDSISRNYKLINLSAFPFLLGEMHSEVTKDMEKIIEQKKFYINQINGKDLETFSKLYDYIDGDRHPTPIAHWNYANQVIKPLLNINNLAINENQAIIDQENLNV